MKIKNKKIVKYSGEVFDLQVSTPDKSYNISDVVVHNSAAGSLVLFILDITKIDPLRFNLIFERFLNPARIDPADIDLDIDSVTQKLVENYLKEKFGDDKVCHIANFGKFGAKTVVKDLCRIFELDFALSNKLTSYFDELKSEIPVDEQIETAKKIAEKKGERDLLGFIEENGPLLITFGKKLSGMVRQVGRHASGILVSNNVLTESSIPLLLLKGDVVTGMQEGGDEREVSELGFCKLDILGLITASVINQAYKYIHAKHGIDHIEKDILLSDFDDEEVWARFESGDCRDIFQFGSDSMITLIKTIKPKNIVDLSSINALFRPAVIQAGGVKEYIKNKSNPAAVEKKMKAIHPKLWDITSESYGVPVFQEHIMFILQDLGGFTLAEADKGRKILKLLHKGNQDKSDAFFEMLDKFKKNALANGITEENLEWLLDVLAKYSEYSFNKCLGSNTYINTINGRKKITDIKAGDIVLSYNFDKDDIYTAEVKEKIDNGKKKIYKVRLDNEDIIECTLDHKFMTKNGNMQTIESIFENNLEIVII